MKLLDAHLDLDLRCNFRCVYCQNRADRLSGQSWFPLEALGALLPALRRSCWTVYLSCGGEPLLHPHFEEALSIVNKYLRGIDVVLVTNGLALSGHKAAAIVGSCISRVQVSVHTVEPALYARLYGCRETDCTRVLRNIEGLLRLRGEKKWPKVLLTAIAMQSTLAGLPGVAKWGGAAGIDGMRIHWLEPFDTPGMDAEVVSPAKAEAAIKEAQRILNAVGAYVEWPTSLSVQKVRSMLRGASTVRSRFDYFLAAAGKLAGLLGKKRCSMAGYSFRLTNTGDVRFCHLDAVALPNLLANPSMNLRRVLKVAAGKLDCSTNPCCGQCPFRPQ